MSNPALTVLRIVSRHWCIPWTRAGSWFSCCWSFNSSCHDYDDHYDRYMLMIIMWQLCILNLWNRGVVKRKAHQEKNQTENLKSFNRISFDSKRFYLSDPCASLILNKGSLEFTHVVKSLCLKNGKSHKFAFAWQTTAKHCSFSFSSRSKSCKS